jgi:hypothetical protein
MTFIDTHLNILRNNVHKSALRITTPMAVFVTASGNFALLIAVKFWESCRVSNGGGRGVEIVVS